METGTRHIKNQYVGKASPLTQQVVVGVPFVLEGQAAIAHVVEVLEPLEVGDRHTASVQVHVLCAAEHAVSAFIHWL